MKKEDFKKRAEDMLKQLDEIRSNGESIEIFNVDFSNPYPGLRELLMDFVHLVYSFDHNLPLNKFIEDLPNIRMRPTYAYPNGSEESFARIKYYIGYFIHYLEEYCE